jgi:hypothetical protein
MLSVILTLNGTGETLGDVRDFYRKALLFGVTEEAPLVDGGHVRLEFDDVPVLDVVEDGRKDRPALKDLAYWLKQRAELPAESATRYATELALDLTVYGIVEIACGEHVGESPSNVLLYTQPGCRDHEL